MPGRKQRLAEEGGLLVAGDPADRDPGGQPGTTPAAVVPSRPLEGPTSGSVDIGTPNRSASSSSQASRPMSKSRVRQALVGSVAWTAPPVSRHSSQLSTVPKARSGRLRRRPRRAARPAWWPRSTGRGPGRSGADQPEVPGRLERCGTAAAARRSCQTMARWRGRPVAAVPQHDGLALVGDADGGDRARAASSSSSRQGRGHGGPDLLGIVLHPARAGGSTAGTPGSRLRPGGPSSSTAMARTPVVPASMAMTTAMRTR